jgi:hypothetical protein
VTLRVIGALVTVVRVPLAVLVVTVEVGRVPVEAICPVLDEEVATVAVLFGVGRE